MKNISLFFLKIICRLKNYYYICNVKIILTTKNITTMTQTNYKAMTDNELNTVSNELHDQSLKCLFKYKQAISNLIKKYMPNCYLESLYNNTMTIGFNEHEGWFRNLSISIYFGIDCWAQEKGFKFQINPSSIGTFNIFDDCEEKAYYVAIGTILSNNEFNILLHGNLKHFYEEYMPIEQEIYAVCDEIRKRENEKKKAEELAKCKEEFTSTKEQILSKDNSGKYVIITKHDKGVLNNAIYRKKSVRVMPYGVSNLTTMLDILQEKEGRYWESYYRIVMVDKIKLIEE